MSAPYFGAELQEFDARDRDVIGAIGMIVTDLGQSAMRALLMPDHESVETLSSHTLNLRLDRVHSCPGSALVTWGLTYLAYRKQFPREIVIDDTPDEDEREERFSSVRDRLRSSAQE